MSRTYIPITPIIEGIGQFWRCVKCDIPIADKKLHKHLDKKLLKEIKEMEANKNG